MSIITIKNFQSHTDTQLDIKEHAINVIVGPSRSGKSAIFRAVEALCLNSTIDRRNETKETAIEWNGVARRRSNTINQYELDGAVFKALRSSIPRQVTDRLRLKEINFRPQHQQYFLINDSPGAVARAMNEWADLGMIDYVAQQLAKDKKEAESLLKGLDEIREQQENEIARLTWADVACEKVSLVEDLEARIRKLQAEETTLRQLLGQLEELAGNLTPSPEGAVARLEGALKGLEEDKVSALSDVLNGIARVSPPPSVTARLKQLTDLAGQLKVETTRELSELLNAIEEIAEDLKACPDIQKALIRVAEAQSIMASDDSALTDTLNKLAEVSVPPDPTPALAKVNEMLNRLADNESSLAATLDLYYKTRGAAEKAAQDEDELREAFNTKLREAGQCPLCGGQQHGTSEDSCCL